MADGVLKELDNQQKREDEMIAKYEALRERKLRRAQENKEKKMKQIMDEVKSTLDSQVQEKKKREQDIRMDLNQQATMWKKERDLWEEEDKRIQEKIK